MKRVHIIYMAAGNSRRFGSNKLLHEWRGKELFRYGLDMLLELVSEEEETGDPVPETDLTLTVVTQYTEIEDYVRTWIREKIPAKKATSVEVIVNPDSRLGASHTIRAGIRHVQEKYGAFQIDAEMEKSRKEYLLFMVADQPLIRKTSVKRMLEKVDVIERSGAAVPSALSLSYRGQVGNPCIFPAELLEELLALEGDRGGRSVLRKHGCLYVEAEAAEELMDIDRE